MLEVAQTNDRGLHVILFRHLLELSLSSYEATIFYWVLFVLSGLMSLLGLFIFYSCLTSTAKVVLTNEEIRIPSSLFTPHKTISILYGEILSLKLHTVQNPRSLKIIHQKGKKHLNENLLPQKNRLDEIIFILIPIVNEY